MKKESFSWPPGCLFTMTVHEELCCELEKKKIHFGRGGAWRRRQKKRQWQTLGWSPASLSPHPHRGQEGSLTTQLWSCCCCFITVLQAFPAL